MLYIAICMQILGSFLFAGGAILQSLGVRSQFDQDGRASDNKLSLRGLFRLVLIPKWTIGLACVLVGAGINFAALTLAPVAVVQPIGILAVIWSVILAAKVHRRGIPPRVWIAVAVTFVGLVGFTWISTTSATGNHEAQMVDLLVAFAVVLVLCLALGAATKRAVPWLKATLWSSIGAMLYGLATGMLKATADLLLRYDNPILDLEVLLTVSTMLIGFIGGAWMIQQGYASGPAEITVATMTTVDPVVAVLFGLIVLGEGLDVTVLDAIGMVALGAVAILGVVLLSRDHPDAAAEREKTPDPETDPEPEPQPAA